MSNSRSAVSRTRMAAAAFVVFWCFGTGYSGPGRVDLSLSVNFANGAQINVIEMQPDGRVIVAGSFQILNETRRDIIRLNANNTIDSTFNAGAGLAGNGGTILAVKVQPDGKILIGGTFNNFNNNFVSRLIRLNSDGTVDQTFNLNGLDVTFVFDIDLQSTGKVMISAMNLIGSSFVARFAANGTYDPGFSFPFFGGSGFKIDVGSGDRIILGGAFVYTVNQIEFRNLARLGPDGSVDGTFSANIAASTYPSVDPVEISGGRVLFWGRFDFVNNVTRRGVAIVNGDGSTYTPFDPSAIQVENIRAAVYQPDGKVVIGGDNFTRTNTRLRGNIARLNADGSIDASFFQGRGANGAVRVLTLRDADHLLLGGDFFRYDRAVKKGLVQIFL